MRLFFNVVRVSIQRQLTYRAAMLAGLATNFFFGLLRAAVIVALFGAQQQVAGISINSAITYTGISQATIAFLSLFSWYEVMRSVYSGEIGSDLLKPMNYYVFWMAQDLGRAVVNLVMRGLPIMAFYALVFDITTPKTVTQWLALAAALLLGWMVSFAWRFLVNLAAFWMPNAIGFGRLFFTLAWFMSGFLMPMRFFPDWYVKICYLTPFPHTVNTIIEVYLGLLKGPQVWQALLGQVSWILGLAGFSQLVMRAGIRRLVIQGG